MNGFGPAVLVCRSGLGFTAEFTEGRSGFGIKISCDHPAVQSKESLKSDSAFLSVLRGNATNLAPRIQMSLAWPELECQRPHNAYRSFERIVLRLHWQSQWHPKPAHLMLISTPSIR